MKAVSHESGRESAVVYREPSAGADPLDDVAGVARRLALSCGAGVCRRHRAFGDALCARPPADRSGAQALAGGAPDILAVALDAGYGSHEAFTRAFRDQFGVTPERCARRHLDQLDLVEPILMDQSASPHWSRRASKPAGRS